MEKHTTKNETLNLEKIMTKNLFIIALSLGAIYNASASFITGTAIGIVGGAYGSTTQFAFYTVHDGDTVTASYGYNPASATIDSSGNITFGFIILTPTDGLNFFNVPGVTGFSSGGAMWDVTISPTGIPLSGMGFNGIVDMSGSGGGFGFSADLLSFPVPQAGVGVNFNPQSTADTGTTFALLGFAVSGLAGLRRFLR